MSANSHQHKITPRQLVALLAAYYGERASYRPTGVYGVGHEKAGQPYWMPQTNMGGAVSRMTDNLRKRGYLTEYNRHEDFGDKSSNDLTVLGYEALMERLDELPAIEDIYGKEIFRFHIDLTEIEARLAARSEREAEMICQREAARKATRERLRANVERATRDKIVKLRELFGAEALADNWSDEKLLEFADKVASA